MRNVRYRFGCFSVTENGSVSKVVAVAGSDGSRTLSSAEMLDVETMQWQNLPGLPFQVYDNKGVESVTRPYLGFSVGGFSRSIEKIIIELRNNMEKSFWNIGKIGRKLLVNN